VAAVGILFGAVAAAAADSKEGEEEERE